MTKIQIMIVFIVIFIVLLVLVVVIPILASRSYDAEKHRHEYGECVVASLLSELPAEYRVFNGVFLSSGAFKTRIGHIVISRFGIFVIETRNVRGTVSGSDFKKDWEVRLKKNIRYMSSPVFDNGIHIDWLSGILGLRPSDFKGIVVFMDTARVYAASGKAKILYSPALVDYILSFRNRKFTDGEADRFSKLIESSMQKDGQGKLSGRREDS